MGALIAYNDLAPAAVSKDVLAGAGMNFATVSSTWPLANLVKRPLARKTLITYDSSPVGGPNTITIRLYNGLTDTTPAVTGDDLDDSIQAAALLDLNFDASHFTQVAAQRLNSAGATIGSAVTIDLSSNLSRARARSRWPHNLVFDFGGALALADGVQFVFTLFDEVTGSLHIGRAMAFGSAIRLVNGIDAEWGVGVEDSSVVQYGRSRVPATLQGKTFRRIFGAVSNIPEADAYGADTGLVDDSTGLWVDFIAQGRGRDVLLAHRSGANHLQRLPVVGRLEGTPQLTHTGGGYYRSEFSLVESR